MSKPLFPIRKVKTIEDDILMALIALRTVREKLQAGSTAIADFNVRHRSRVKTEIKMLEIVTLVEELRDIAIKIDLLSGLTQSKVGEKYNLSRSRISQINSKVEI